MTRTILTLDSQSHRVWDFAREGNTEVMTCDCHGYRLERTLEEGKRPSLWVRVRITQD